MLETVRAAPNLLRRQRRRALDALARLCTRKPPYAEGLRGTCAGGWLDRVRDDSSNYRGAMRWLIACGRSPKRRISPGAEALCSSGDMPAPPVVSGILVAVSLARRRLKPSRERRCWGSAGELEQARCGLNRVLGLSTAMAFVVRAQDLRARRTRVEIRVQPTTGSRSRLKGSGHDPVSIETR